MGITGLGWLAGLAATALRLPCQFKGEVVVDAVARAGLEAELAVLPAGVLVLGATLLLAGIVTE